MRTVVDAVRWWVEQIPERVAVEHAGRSWTYAELGRSAARTAADLARHVSPGEVVAVTGERSFATVAAMLGVLESGAVLLTLDPKLPRERRELMRAQAGIVLELVPPKCPFCPPQSWEEKETLPHVEPHQAAYVFFTSGSTGTPKAVLGTHAGLGHFLDWQRHEFGIRLRDRASQLTALSFDVVLRDVFLVLTSGGTLCIPSEADVVQPDKILTWLSEQSVTVLHVVPSLMRYWLRAVPRGYKAPPLRRVFFAGEPLTDTLVRQFREVFGTGAEVVNLYGPTETTLAKCFYRVPDNPAPGVQPIGSPLPGTEVLILDDERRPAAPGEVGQIAIRTEFRTRGYLNDPAATARAFVLCPFGAHPDELVYLTGDRGRRRADGLLEILGRIDNQVKIRGVRIEPGEIEAVLMRHPDVREAVVVARDEGDAKVLMAYVVALGSSVEGLLAFAAERLPKVMVPKAVTVLSSLPLNANGKVDRRALAAGLV